MIHTLKAEIDLKSNKCNFTQCRYYEDGICASGVARRECLEIAFDVLCLDMEKLNEQNSSQHE